MSPLEAIDRMAGQPVLVIGDMIADIYLYGNIARISREAPVLVLEQSHERVVAGGAANVINNAATLGGKVFAAGLVGDDSGADGLVEILSGRGVDVRGFVRDAGRPTISKTRIVAGAGLLSASRLSGWTRRVGSPCRLAARGCWRHTCPMCCQG